ncbi:unnamed protein product [Schistosoma turkestanicum]|nr:unnamed protein product [Schistosoma turkestanicum]
MRVKFPILHHSEGIYLTLKSSNFVHKCIFICRRAQEDINNVCKTLLNEDSDEELEIPIVPDLSSAEDQSITFEGAVAPSVVINKIPSYSELTQDLLHHGMLQLLDDHINIRVLTRHLFSESELQESDETWGWDFLFTELKTLR